MSLRERHPRIINFKVTLSLAREDGEYISHWTIYLLFFDSEHFDLYNSIFVSMFAKCEKIRYHRKFV